MVLREPVSIGERIRTPKLHAYLHSASVAFICIYSVQLFVAPWDRALLLVFLWILKTVETQVFFNLR